MAVTTPLTQPTTFLVSDPTTRLREKFGDKLVSVSEFRGETTITLARENLVDVAQMLRDEIGFEQLVDVSALDWHLQAKNAPNPSGVLFNDETLDEIELPPRYQVLYHFLSHALNARLRMTVFLKEFDVNIPSLTSLYPGANFFEREVYDML